MGDLSLGRSTYFYCWDLINLKKLGDILEHMLRYTGSWFIHGSDTNNTSSISVWSSTTWDSNSPSLIGIPWG